MNARAALDTWRRRGASADPTTLALPATRPAGARSGTGGGVDRLETIIGAAPAMHTAAARNADASDARRGMSRRRVDEGLGPVSLGDR